MKSTIVLVALISCIFFNIANGNDEYQVYLTTGDQSKKLSHEAPCRVTSSHNGYSVWVDRRKRRQTIDGFGAALTNSAAYVIYHSPVRQQILQDLFGNGDNDLGVSYIRLPMGCSDLNAVQPYTYNDIPNGQTDFSLNQFSIDKDRAFVIPVIKEALSINPTLKIMATPWSAPAWMKNNRNLNGGDFVDSWNYWQTYAQYFVKFIEAYKAEGITIESLTLQNEPLLSRNDYPTMKMSAGQQQAFIRDHLGPLFRQRNIHTKILVFDHNWSDSWYPEQVISDGNTKQYVSGVAWHGYSGRHDAPGVFHGKLSDVGMYFSEISGGSWDTNFASILTWDTRIIFIGQTRNWAKSVLLWNIALDQNHGPKVANLGGCNDCRGVITVQNNYYNKNAEYYALAHMSKFVKPGAVRLESNYVSWDDLRTAAFVNTDGTTVIVVSNPNSSKSATFSLDIDAKHYQYNNLPPQSVVTFVK
ncbi:uncharacterized protein LOC123525833 [Mercenaria mercenaria]|uniref:uncharacterized protein LOC123525833 n=1 Tax=Mercenaria mercenaria TaxID=6596 RepID=UPI00234E5321|nr:uncharacterized protein LOC123525833 [Mercenaria mercenaria]